MAQYTEAQRQAARGRAQAEAEAAAKAAEEAAKAAEEAAKAEEEAAKAETNPSETMIHRAYINGFEDGTFLPEKLITRAEAVKIFNSYLGRRVNYNGLSGVPGGSIWSDVSPTHWAYLEIVEAANDHTYHWNDADDPTPPERWETAGEI